MQAAFVSVVVIKGENLFVCIPFFPVGIMNWKSMSTHRRWILQCWQSEVIKVQVSISCTYRKQMCSSLFMMWFSKGKIHSKTLKHCFIKSSFGNVPDFSGQVSTAWHIFGRLMDNGAKHKTLACLIYSQWSLIAADLGNKHCKCHCFWDLQAVLCRCDCPADVSNS